ncbi:MAG: hypothetical protein ACI4AB_02770 [Acetatifactor sp.]
MKLRYYLRGLGIGIIVTALVMGLSNRDARPLTDAEIKAKAAALGMVESDSLKLTDVVLSPEPTVEPTAEATATPEPTTEPTTEATATPEPPVEPTAEVTATPEPTTVSITIKSGSGSETVCRQLENAGLIENAGAFDQYLIDNGYSKRICVGTYEIQIGTTEEEIAKIITKTR